MERLRYTHCPIFKAIRAMIIKRYVDQYCRGALIYLLSMLLLVLGTNQTMAQACCSGGTPLAGSLGLQYLPQGSVLLEFNYDYNAQQDLVDGSIVLDQNPRRRNTHSLLLRGVYALNNRFSVFSLLSIIRQEEVTRPLSGGKRLLFAQGLGDAVFFGQYAFNDDQSKFQLLGGAGLTVPIGGVRATSPDTGLPLHPDLQPGTGAWDILLGVRLSQQHFIKQNLQLLAHFTYRATNPAQRYSGRQEYEFGDELRILFGGSDSYTTAMGIWSPSLLVLFRATAKDRTNGITSPNTGGQWWHLRPGIGLAFNPRWSVNAFGEFPLSRNLTGVQLSTSFRFRISLGFRLATGKQQLPSTLGPI